MGNNLTHDHHLNSAASENNHHHQECEDQKLKTAIADGKGQNQNSSFKIPLHYPKYTKSDYEKMAEWQLDQLLREYGLPIMGDSYEKRKFAMGAFLWSPEN